MKIVIQSVGIIFVFAGAANLLKPEIMKSVMEFFKQGKRLYFAGVIRLVLAIIFLIGARDCNIPWVMIVLGILIMVSGLLIFVIRLEKLKSIIEWWQKRPALLLRSLALAVLAVGAIVIYCA